MRGAHGGGFVMEKSACENTDVCGTVGGDTEDVALCVLDELRIIDIL